MRTIITASVKKMTIIQYICENCNKLSGTPVVILKIAQQDDVSFFESGLKKTQEATKGSASEQVMKAQTDLNEGIQNAIKHDVTIVPHCFHCNYEQSWAIFINKIIKIKKIINIIGTILSIVSFFLVILYLSATEISFSNSFIIALVSLFCIYIIFEIIKIIVQKKCINKIGEQIETMGCNKPCVVTNLEQFSNEYKAEAMSLREPTIHQPQATVKYFKKSLGAIIKVENNISAYCLDINGNWIYHQPSISVMYGDTDADEITEEEVQCIINNSRIKTE